MSITTYSELQTAIANRLDRFDLTSVIPDFITIAEVEINDLLRTADMETRATTSTVAGQAYYPVPDNFAGLRRLAITGSEGHGLEILSPQNFDDRFLFSDNNEPFYATVQDNQLRFGPTPDAVYTVEISYYKQVPALSVSNTTNWLLTSHPNVYLFGALKDAGDYVHDDRRISIYEAKFQTAISRLQRSDQFNRYPGPYSMQHSQSTNDGRK